MRIQLSFVQFSLSCYEFCILSKTKRMSIYYHFTRDYKTSSFQKLARNKWICRETCVSFFMIKLGGIKIKKQNFFQYKRPISIDNIDNNKIVVSNKVSFDKDI